MCDTCGCGDTTFTTKHKHSHSQEHHHNHDEVSVEQKILGFNDEIAHQNEHFFHDKGIFCLNLLSSPGSGKTTLLEMTLRELGDEFKIGLVEGDQQTDLDAKRLMKYNKNVTQINTNRGCHLDSNMVHHALENLDLQNLELLFVENVGNLVCPSMFKLGEAKKVVILSVTEGEDKPLKYPNAFFESELAIISKTDLLPYLDFDVEKCIGYIKQVKPEMKIILLSSKTMEGFDEWKNWLIEGKENFTSKPMQHH